MALGPRVRARLGQWEVPVANLYRACFVDLESLVQCVRVWAPALRILEIGCGEGALTERLASAYPDAYLTGIDITPRVGRLYQGDPRRVTFVQTTVQDFVSTHQCDFDLVVLCDVLHHVPWHVHRDLLTTAMKALKPGGGLVLKEWEKRRTPIHLLAYLSDRYFTGDRVRFGTADYFRSLVSASVGNESIEQEFRVRPWRNNLVFFARLPALAT